MLKNSQRTSRKGGTTPAWSPADPLPMDSPSQPPSPSPHLCPWCISALSRLLLPLCFLVKILFFLYGPIDSSPPPGNLP